MDHRAKRSLATLELRHALAVEIGEPELDKENLLEIEDMVSAHRRCWRVLVQIHGYV